MDSRFKGYGPVIMIIALLAGLAGAQAIFGRGAQPEMFQSQVGATENSLQEVKFFDLEIELKDDSEIEVRYGARGEGSQRAELRRDDRNERLLGDEALEQVRVIVESSPPLTSAEPLTLIQGVLDQLEIHQADVKEFELEYELNDGRERKIELEVDKDRDDDDDDWDDDWDDD
ncbi:MAG: hypothetical protein GX251_08405 [Firmicutes bacterium]|nr:hypothetical protein [Bacillota bacterium]